MFLAIFQEKMGLGSKPNYILLPMEGGSIIQYKLMSQIKNLDMKGKEKLKKIEL